MYPEKYRQLCIKAINGEITEFENRALQEWLAQSSDSQQYFEMLIWNHSEAPVILNKPETTAGWQELAKSLDILDLPGRSSKSVPFRKHVERVINSFRKRRLAFSAAVSLAMIILLFVLRPKSPGVEILNVTTHNGQRSQVYLPDGTFVQLNSASSIEYFNRFTDTLRKVTLKGEAFFEVMRDARPFVIVTENSRLTVLGTSFDVWARGMETRVIVKNGKVRFSSLARHDHYIELSANEMSKAVKQEMPSPSETVEAERLLGWLDNKLIFERTPLVEIFEELRRQYDVVMELDPSISENTTFTASFENASIETILTTICQAADLNYTVRNNVHIIGK